MRKSLPSRPYHSAVRQQQADKTRRRIVASARKLLRFEGYAGTTIDRIAKEAGVAPQTVYAVFGSKRGILREILSDAMFGPAYQDLVQRALETEEPATRLPFAARIARQVHDSKRAEMVLLRGAGVVAPELASLERERERQRFEAQAQMISHIARAGGLRPRLSKIRAREILWALTGPDLYRMLVVERGWKREEYEKWLGDLLVAALIRKKQPLIPGHTTSGEQVCPVNRKKRKRRGPDFRATSG